MLRTLKLLFGIRATPAYTSAPASNPEEAWERIDAALTSKYQLLLCVKEFCGAKYIRVRAAEKLLDNHLSALTIKDLGLIICETSGSPAAIRAAQQILAIARNKDELGQVVVSTGIPMELRLEAAKRTLAEGPGQHDLFRCLHIPELAEEALTRLLSPETSDDSLLHLVQFGDRQGYVLPDGNPFEVRERVVEYLVKSDRCVGLPTKAQMILEAFWNWDWRSPTKTAAA